VRNPPNLGECMRKFCLVLVAISAILLICGCVPEVVTPESPDSPKIPSYAVTSPPAGDAPTKEAELGATGPEIIQTPNPYEYPAPSIYYPMDNIHEAAVRPDGKELYIYGVESPIILIVDIDSPDYPVVGEIQLPGKKAAPIPYISFSRDGTHAYMSRALQCDYEGDCTNFSDFTSIIAIDTVNRKIESVIPMPQPYSPTASVVPSQDGKWLYFTAADFSSQLLSIGKIDLENHEVVDFLPLEDVNFITLSGDGKYIYATQGWNLFGTPENLLSVIDTETFEVISSVTVGDGPRYTAITPDGRKAYVSNQWSNDISIIDIETMEVTSTIAVGHEPRVIAMTPDGRKAYVTLPGASAGESAYQFGDSIAIIDVERDKLLDTIKVDLEPESIAISTDGTRAYVSDGNANGRNPAEVHVIDIMNDSYLRPIILRQAARYTPTAVDVTPDNRKLFIASEATGKLLVIDIATGSTLGELDVQPRGVKVSADGSRVYVFSPQKLSIINSDSLDVIKLVDLGNVYPTPVKGDQEAFRIVLNHAEDIAYLQGDTEEVVVVNLTEGVVVARISFSDLPIHHSRGLALTPDESKLFVSDYHSQTVAVINTSSNTIIARIPVANMPSEIKVSQDGKRVYVLQTHSTTLITIIDADTLEVLKSIDFPGRIACALDFELSQDERYAYIACFDPNFIMVYDLHKDTVADVIDVGLDPFNVVSSPDRRLIYVSNFTSDDISVIDTTTNSLIKTIGLGKSEE